MIQKNLAGGAGHSAGRTAHPGAGTWAQPHAGLSPQQAPGATMFSHAPGPYAATGFGSPRALGATMPMGATFGAPLSPGHPSLPSRSQPSITVEHLLSQLLSVAQLDGELAGLAPGALQAAAERQVQQVFDGLDAHSQQALLQRAATVALSSAAGTQAQGLFDALGPDGRQALLQTAAGTALARAAEDRIQQAFDDLGPDGQGALLRNAARQAVDEQMAQKAVNGKIGWGELAFYGFLATAALGIAALAIVPTATLAQAPLVGTALSTAGTYLAGTQFGGWMASTAYPFMTNSAIPALLSNTAGFAVAGIGSLLCARNAIRSESALGTIGNLVLSAALGFAAAEVIGISSVVATAAASPMATKLWQNIIGNTAQAAAGAEQAM